MRIVHIDERPVCSTAKIVIKLSLGSLHTFKTSETEQMSLADIGYQSIVRKGDIDELLDVPRMARAHLDDCKLSLGIDLQEGKRHSDAVVQIAFRCSHSVPHRQDLTDKLLCGSLTVCTSQSNDCQRLAINDSHGPMPACKLLKSLERILDLDETRIIDRAGR